jgi:hypothetical protein
MFFVVPIEVRGQQILRTRVSSSGFQHAVHFSRMGIELFLLEKGPDGLEGKASIEAA